MSRGRFQLRGIVVTSVPTSTNGNRPDDCCSSGPHEIQQASGHETFAVDSCDSFHLTGRNPLRRAVGHDQSLSVIFTFPHNELPNLAPCTLDNERYNHSSDSLKASSINCNWIVFTDSPAAKFTVGLAGFTKS